MKIQSYRSKAQRTDQVIAQPLQAQANSSAFEAVGQAVAGFQQTADNASKWFVAQQKLENATQVAAGERNYQTKLAQIKDTIEADPKFNSSPIEIEKEFKKRTDIVRGITRLTVKGSRAKTTFNSNALSTTATLASKVKQNARVRLTAQSITEQLELSDNIQTQLSKLDPVRDKVEYEKLEDRLYGNVKTGKIGIFDGLEDIGHIDAKQKFTYVKSAKNKVAVQQVEKGLFAANSLSGGQLDIANGAAARKANEVLLRIQAGGYDGLTVQARMDLAERTQGLIGRLESSRLSKIARNDSKQAKTIKKTQTNTYAGLLGSIIDAQSNPDDKDKQQKKPTLAELQLLVTQQKLSPPQYDNVIAALNEQFAAVTDKVYLSKLYNRVRSAKDKGELELIVDEAYANLSPTSPTPLNFQQVIQVQQAADAFATKTPRSKDVAILGNLLDSYTRPEGVLEKLLGGASLRGDIVNNQFDSLMLDVANDPLTAFQDAIKQFEIIERKNLNSIPYPMFPPVQATMQQDPNDKVYSTQPRARNVSLNKWTVEMVEESRATTMSKFKGKASLLGGELFKLRMLQKYIENKEELTPEVRAKMAKQAGELSEKNQ